MITAQQAADQAAELKHIRQELAYIARALSPWIEMAEMCQRYGVCSKTLLAMEAELRAALAAQPVEPTMDTVLRNAARRAGTVVARGRLVQPAEPVAWADKAMELATDFGVESLRVGSSERQDIYLCDGRASWKTVALREKRETARGRLRHHLYAAPAAVPLTEEWAADVLGIPHDPLPVSEFSEHQRERIACVLAGARAARKEE